VTSEDVLYCERHPDVETGLRCGRCETPICPKCAVFTDVGARCPTCAPRRKLPQFEITPQYFLRGLGAGLGAAAAVGAIWGLLLPGGFGFFSIFVGMGVGYVVGEAVSLATNRKAGELLQGVAIAGAVAAYLVHNVVGGDSLIDTNDFGGLIALIAAIVVAAGRVRF
jgi:hypothetical protein